MASYYIQWKGVVQGPYQEEAVKKMIMSNQISMMHLISADRKQWEPLSKSTLYLDVASAYTPKSAQQSKLTTEQNSQTRQHTARIPVLTIKNGGDTASTQRPPIRVERVYPFGPEPHRDNTIPQPPIRLTTDLLRDPKEGLAFGWLMFFSLFSWLFISGMVIALFGVGLLVIGKVVTFFSIGLCVIIVTTLVVYLCQLFAAAYIKTNALRVSENQIPELHEIMVRFARQIGRPLPEVYVMQEYVWNALAVKLAGRRMVVLFSGAVDSLLEKGSMSQLAWLAGHELGHHFAGHLNLWTRTIKFLGAWFFWIEFWYARRCELTCDRYGLACSNSLDESLRAVCNMTVGAQLAPSVNIVEAVAQWRHHRSEFFVKYRTLYSTHPHTLWRLDELTRSASEIGIPN